MAQEIERKYLVRITDPDVLRKAKKKQIVQYYLKATDAEEVRIRSVDNKQFFYTEKTGVGIERTENEEEITKEEFNSYLKGGNFPMIQKTRHMIDRWEIDVYIKPVLGNDMAIAEIELTSKHEQAPFNLTGLEIVKEVTEDKAYKNKSIAVKGFPTLQESVLSEGATSLENLRMLLKEVKNRHLSNKGVEYIAVVRDPSTGEFAEISSYKGHAQDNIVYQLRQLVTKYDESHGIDPKKQWE